MTTIFLKILFNLLKGFVNDFRFENLLLRNWDGVSYYGWANNIQQGCGWLHKCRTCRCLITRFELFKLQHIYREANSYANILAKAGCAQQLNFISFATPPNHILEASKFNCSCSVCTHLIIVNVFFFSTQKGLQSWVWTVVGAGLWHLGVFDCIERRDDQLV